MKPDIDIDTEKYSGHNIRNNMFIKTFSDPENMKIFDFPEMNIERRKNGVMGHLVKKISYYTFPPTNHTFTPLNYKFPPPK